MSVTLDWDMREALPALKGAKLSVLMALLLRKNIRNRCWPSTDCLMKDTGLNRSTVLEAKKGLEDMQAFKIVPYDKRMEEELELPNRQHIYELTGTVQVGEREIPYLYLNTSKSEKPTMEGRKIQPSENPTLSISNKDSLSKSKEDSSAPDGAAVSEVIHAWLSNLPAQPVNGKNPYQIPEYRKRATIWLRSGYKAKQLSQYVQAVTATGAFWHNKHLPFTRALDDAPAWLSANGYSLNGKNKNFEYQHELEALQVEYADILPYVGQPCSDEAIIARCDEYQVKYTALVSKKDTVR